MFISIDFKAFLTLLEFHSNGVILSLEVHLSDIKTVNSYSTL